MYKALLQKQTWLNYVYLALAFPLGLFYFVFLVTGLSVGFSLLVIWIGVPILVAVSLGWWWLGSFERSLTINLLNVQIHPMSYINTKSLSPGRKLRTHLSNSITWQSLFYLFAKFPFGIFSLVVVTVVPSVIFGLIFAPLIYVLDHLLWNSNQNFKGWVFYIPVDGNFSPLKVVALLPLTFVGLVIAPYISAKVINGLAYGWGQFARVMLGKTQTAIQLEQTRAVAEQQRVRADRSDQSRRELIVNVSHELRTPIASIKGHVESLMMSNEGKPGYVDPATHNYLGIVHQEAERLGALVDDLLSLARAEADELRLDIRPGVPGEVVEEVYQTLMPLAQREKEIMLVRNVAPYLPQAMFDRQRLLQVLLNLVRNAINYTPTGGLVSIELEQVDFGHLALTVTDTGIGIAPGELEHVFERFYRADSSRSRSSGGFGLGLAIVKELVTAMGGTISVTSTPGQGSRFQVLLRTAAAAQSWPQPQPIRP